MANNWIFNSEMIPLLERSLASEHFADAGDGVALGIAEGEEFETVAEALTIADDGADFQGIGAEGQRNVEGNDFATFEFSGEGGADTILTEFSRASPTGAELAILEHADLHADIHGIARIAAGVGHGGEFLSRRSHRALRDFAIL